MRLKAVLNPETLIRLMDELGADDRRVLLMIIGQLQAVLAMAEVSAQDVLSDDELEVMRGVLAGLHRYLAIFDKGLGRGIRTGTRVSPSMAPIKDSRRWQSGGNFCGSSLEVPVMPG